MNIEPSYEELKIQLEILKSKDRTQTILDCAEVMFIEIDTDGIITLVNKKACEIFGYDEKEMLGKNWFENFLPERIKEEILPISKKLLSGEIETTEYYENPILTKKGKERLIYWHNVLIKDNNGNITGHLSSGEDITERKKAERHVKMLADMVEQSPAAIVITNLDGNIEYVNKSFTNVTGYSFKEAIGQNSRILNSGKNDPEMYIKLWNKISNGKTWKGDFINIRKNGEEYYEKAIISPTTNLKGEIVNYFAIKEDVTLQKLAEKAIKTSEKELKEANAMKDKLFSIIAHDLRNPFNAILGFSDLLLQNNAIYDEQKREELLNPIIESAENAYRLLENLLEWSRTKIGRIAFNPDKYILEKIIIDVIGQLEFIAKQKDIELSYKLIGNIIINVDEAMINTVLRNLITNSIKFTHKSGKVEILASQDHDGVTISVKDTGVGIDKKKLQDIFSILDYEATKGTENEKGSGLGLVLCKEFVEMHGGRIWAESEEGIGSTFSFTIPTKRE